MQNEKRFVSEQSQSNNLNKKDGQSGTVREAFAKNGRKSNSSNFVSNHLPRRAHKPRTGKRMREFDGADTISNNNNIIDMSNNDNTEGNNSNDHMQESNEHLEDMQKAEVKHAKTTSTFAQLQRSLCSADAIVTFIREGHTGNKFDTVKALNTFLQAISNRPENNIYEELVQNYPREVMYILEKLFSYVSVNVKVFPPQAHEFVIRCEQNGLRKVDASALNKANTSDNTETFTADAPIYSPRELIKKLIALDPRGRWMRKVELCNSLADIRKCTSKLNDLFASELANMSDYAEKCQLLSKLISKARRVIHFMCTQNKSNEESAGESTLPESSSNNNERKEHSTKLLHDNVEEVEKDLSKSLMELHLPSEVRKECKEINTELVELMCDVFSARPVNSTQQPITKCIHYVRWCKEHKLIKKNDMNNILSFEEEVNKDLEKQAVQLETVMKLKSLQHSHGIATNNNIENNVSDSNANHVNSGDNDTGINDKISTINTKTESLVDLINMLWQAGDETHFEPCSADVLSSIATAVTNAISSGAVDNAVKEQVAYRLVQTQLYLNKKNTQSKQQQLPRRALRLVQSVRDAHKHAALTARLAKKNAN